MHSHFYLNFRFYQFIYKYYQILINNNSIIVFYNHYDSLIAFTPTDPFKKKHYYEDFVLYK